MHLEVDSNGVISVHGLVIDGKYPYVTDYRIKKKIGKNQAEHEDEDRVTIVINAALKSPDTRL